MIRRGLTLVELVLAIGLAGILGIPTGLLLSQHLRAVLTARDSTVAIQLARYKMEQLDSLNNFFATDLDPGATMAGKSTITPNYLGYPYDLGVVVSCLQAVTNCTSTSTTTQAVKKIVITVATSVGPDAVARPAISTWRPLARLLSSRTKCVCFGTIFTSVPTSCSGIC